MTIAVIDTETTGLDPNSASILELGVVKLPGFETFTRIVKPEHEIEIQAMAAHHITEDMVKKGSSLEEAIKFSKISKEKFICAHNAAFDSGFLKIDKPWICTYRCARHLWPEAPAYSNQVLRYWLRIEEQLYSGEGAKIMQLPPHRALPDAWVTAHILYKMLTDNKPEKLVELTKTPIMIKTINFGKYKGTLFEKVPRDYLAWMLRQKDFDSDSVYTAKAILGVA
jgi:exodeoxyribonuclease X